MKAIVYKNGAVSLETAYSMPVPGPGESLVRVLLAAVCNTDREMLRGYHPEFEGVLGHEFVGMVEQSDVPHLIGKRVVGELNEGCGHCLYCRTGREHHCEHRRVPGIQRRDGVFAAYIAYPTRLLHTLPAGLSDVQAVYCEPLAAALEIVEKNHIPPSCDVAIVGDGRLALMVAQVLSLSGAAISVYGKHPEKLALFAGFANTSPRLSSYEVVIEASGSPSGLRDAIRLCRSEGLLVLKSTYAGQAELAMSEIVVREITIRGSRCGPFAPALQLLKSKLVQLPPIELYPLEAYEQAFHATAFKAGFDLRGEDVSVSTPG